MFRLPKLSLVLTVFALVLFAASARANDWPVEGDTIFTGGSPPTTTFNFVGAKGDGTAVTGIGQFDFDGMTGVISNGMATLVWDTGFSLDMVFAGQTMIDGTFTGTWSQVGGDLTGTFAGTTDFATGAHTRFDCN